MAIPKMQVQISIYKDARDYQILCITFILVLGLAARDWSLQPTIVATAVLAALGSQGLFAWLMAHKQLSAELSPTEFNWRSPLITALGLSLLLRTDHIATMVLAASIAIASKFFLKVNDKHFFNPANLGIIAALTLTNDACVSPGQWGEEIWYG